MGLSNMIGLVGLIGAPIIIILYMLRPKNKPKVIPSLFLWKQMSEEIESASKIKKLKSSVLMFIQIFVVILMTLIFAGLYVNSQNHVESVLMVIEASYTMGADDIGESRMDVAKKSAADYVNALDEDSLVTLVVLEEVPKTIIRDEGDKNFVVNLIDEIHQVDGICQADLVTETIETLKGGNQEVVYFGDRYFAGIKNVRTLQDDRNFSVHDITYTKYLKEGTITALTEVFNHNKSSEIIPVSLYLDGQFFSAKQVEIEGRSSGKLFFENIPFDTKELHVQIDGEDILAIDDHAYKIVKSEKLQKALLVTSGNQFLEKALSLHPGIELYVGDSAQGLFGYDLYIFDGLLPTDFPVDGNYIIFAPEEREEFELLGYVENPVFTTNDHEITKHIENPGFATRVSGVFEVENPVDIIYNTGYGAGAFETLIYDNKTIIFGFDVHDTDLPLSIEFPVMMMNTMEYLLNSQMVADDPLYVGDSGVISIFPSTKKGSVISPTGIVTELALDRREYVFGGTGEVGIYSVSQEREYDVLEERFAVNIPKMELSDGQVNKEDLVDVSLSTKSLGLLLGIAALLLILIEWLIYSYRRRIHEYKL